jgi:hypothetical protein
MDFWCFCSSQARKSGIVGADGRVSRYPRTSSLTSSGRSTLKGLKRTLQLHQRYFNKSKKRHRVSTSDRKARGRGQGEGGKGTGARKEAGGPTRVMNAKGSKKPKTHLEKMMMMMMRQWQKQKKRRKRRSAPLLAMVVARNEQQSEPLSQWREAERSLRERKGVANGHGQHLSLRPNLSQRSARCNKTI